MCTLVTVEGLLLLFTKCHFINCSVKGEQIVTNRNSKKTNKLNPKLINVFFFQNRSESVTDHWLLIFDCSEMKQRCVFHYATNKVSTLKWKIAQLI